MKTEMALSDRVIENCSARYALDNRPRSFRPRPQELFSRIIEHFSPYREKREYLSRNIDQVHSLLNRGREKASKVADENIKKIRDVMGLNY